MAYETKTLLIAIGEIVKRANDVEEVYKAVAKIANAEGVLLDPFKEE
ncbi:MAG: hypothetical protein FWE74_02830 [Oscillospiraceae bacterium]|nr:hypothetical protein [Oscillospiraceae bacterium]